MTTWHEKAGINVIPWQTQMMQWVCAQASPFILPSPCILLGQVATGRNVPPRWSPKGWTSPSMAATSSYFLAVPPLNSLLSEKIISVLLLSRKLQKAITVKKKNKKCVDIWSYIPHSRGSKLQESRAYWDYSLWVNSINWGDMGEYFFSFILWVHQLLLNKIQFLSVGILFLSIC